MNIVNENLMIIEMNKKKLYLRFSHINRQSNSIWIKSVIYIIICITFFLGYSGDKI